MAPPAMSNSVMSEKTSGNAFCPDALVRVVDSGDVDRWSQRGITSKASFILTDEDEESQDIPKGRMKIWKWIPTLWQNYILPGVFGLDKPVANKLFHRDPVSLQLCSNIVEYTNLIRSIFRVGLLEDAKALAMSLYFPMGQIEADGLSVISAQLWAATYLLLCTFKNVRESEYHDIRSAFSSLAWDSAQVYRETVEFYQVLSNFCSNILPMWKEIEGLAEQIDDADTPFNSITNVPNILLKKSDTPSLDPLTSIRINNDHGLPSNLRFRISPEIKSETLSTDDMQGKDLLDLEYKHHIEVIRELFMSPSACLQNGLSTMEKMRPVFLSILSTDKNEVLPGYELSCRKALIILKQTLKLFLKEVNPSVSMRCEICELIRLVGEEINALVTYTEWALRKFSEFHSMLKLCYNFALLSFDLDLPSFEKILEQEQATQEFQQQVSPVLSEENYLELKVDSLTQLMIEASNPLSKMILIKHVDDDFEWGDFFKTDYHVVLQRLPLRLGRNLLQFTKEDGKLPVQRNKSKESWNVVCHSENSKNNNHPHLLNTESNSKPSPGTSKETA